MPIYADLLDQGTLFLTHRKNRTSYLRDRIHDSFKNKTICLIKNNLTLLANRCDSDKEFCKLKAL